MKLHETTMPALVNVRKLGREVASMDGIAIYSAQIELTPNIKELGIWDSEDLGYVNRLGYQSWGIDYFFKKYVVYKQFRSDYNTFIVINSQSGNHDSVEIELWETIFWPTPFDTIMRNVRKEVGPIIIEFFSDGVIQMYLNDFIIVIQEVLKLQLCSAVLAKFYDPDFDYKIFAEDPFQHIKMAEDSFYDKVSDIDQGSALTKALAFERYCLTKED